MADTDEIKKALENLKLSCDKENNFSATTNNFNELIHFLTKEGNDRKEIADQLINDDILHTIICLLKNDNTPPEILTKAAELAAELAKTDDARKLCTELPVIPLLIKLLHNKDPKVALQGCRALGNICYDNDDARSLVNAHNGTEALLQVLKNNVVGGEGTEQLRNIATGFLLNLTNTYEATQEKVLEAGVINVLCEYLERYPFEDDLCTHILLTLNCITDTELGRQKLMETNMCQTLINLLDKEITCEVTETILELLSDLVESDAIKFQLATSNLCPIVIRLIKEHQGKMDDENLSIMKSASDLIILLLTGDDSMIHLYNDGEGQLFKEIILWLDSPDETLQVAGASAIGNFARQDEHCIQMVTSGIVYKLTSIIRQHSSREGDIRLQHAILSALRNLAIPVANKSAMVANGVVDAILPIANVETFPVVFKLLGTLRMLVDRQEDVACSLGTNESFLNRVIEWCSTDHPGVSGEANRLVAWLIKNSKSSDVMRQVITCGGIPFLVSMATSEHAVMQNESLIALTLISSTVLDLAETEFCSCGLAEQVQKLLNEDIYGLDVKANVLSLISALFKSEKMADSLNSSEVRAGIQKATSYGDSSLNVQAKKVEQLFESLLKTVP